MWIRKADGRQDYVKLVDFIDKHTRMKWSEAVVAAVREAHPELLAEEAQS